MCLAIIALNMLPNWPIIIVANRDELHSRPTLPAMPWNDGEMILGGRLGMTACGRIALLTNYREPAKLSADAPSRGQLTDWYLRSDILAKDYVKMLEQQGPSYNGFNLFIGDQTEFWYCSNRADAAAQRLDSGVIGISNASINTPWPKLKRTQNAVAEHLSTSAQPDPSYLFEIFRDINPAQPDELPDTGIGAEREKLLSSPFISDARYGTRCTTLIMKRTDGKVLFHEKRYGPQAQPNGESTWVVDTIEQKILTMEQDFFH